MTQCRSLIMYYLEDLTINVKHRAVHHSVLFLGLNSTVQTSTFKNKGRHGTDPWPTES